MLHDAYSVGASAIQLSGALATGFERGTAEGEEGAEGANFRGVNIFGQIDSNIDECQILKLLDPK